MNSLDALEKYGLGISRIADVDLRTLYPQQRPNDPQNRFYFGDTMDGSPHKEIAKMIIEDGVFEAKKKYRSTRYCQMMRTMGKINFPDKMLKLISSVREGYLRGKHNLDYIVVLDEPFAETRYGREDVDKSKKPEMWIGHHRAGILLALGRHKAKVIIARDEQQGGCFTNGKIHNYCVKKDV